MIPGFDYVYNGFPAKIVRTVEGPSNTFFTIEYVNAEGKKRKAPGILSTLVKKR